MFRRKPNIEKLVSIVPLMALHKEIYIRPPFLCCKSNFKITQVSQGIRCSDTIWSLFDCLAISNKYCGNISNGNIASFCYGHLWVAF